MMRMASTYRRFGFYLKRLLYHGSKGGDYGQLRLLSTEAGQSTVDSEEIARFARLAQCWWDEYGEFAALHRMNRLRVPAITRALSDTTHIAKPLDGFKILDVGCGGGILSEPLARLGAEVTGIDAAAESVHIANAHRDTDSDIVNRLSYQCTTVEDLSATDTVLYDAVVASEVVEHVSNIDLFIQSTGRLVKPGGSIFLTTINRTQLSYWTAIVMAEDVLGLVPSGVHEWNKFVTPDELESLLSSAGFDVVMRHGMLYNPAWKLWTWVRSTAVNYMIHAVKPGDTTSTTLKPLDTHTPTTRSRTV